MNHATWTLGSVLSLSLSSLDSRATRSDRSQINGLLWLVCWLMMGVGLFCLAMPRTRGQML